MNNKVGALCELLKALHRSHSRWSRDPGADPRQRKLNEKVSKIPIRVIEDLQLEQLLRTALAGGSIDFLSGERYLFLKPPEQEGALLPVLSLKSDFGRSELAIRMALFTFDEQDDVAAIGFRFETPHGDGLHNYHHAQLITSFGKGMKPLPKVPSWLPVSQPALMMSAKTPFALLLGVLIGLYGLGNLEHQLRGFEFLQHFQADLVDLKGGCGAPHN
jgi:hypothetical protein